MDEMRAGSTDSKTVAETETYEKKAAEAKERWGGTEAYREYEMKAAGRSKAETDAAGAELMEILSVFGALKEKPASDPEAQAQVRKLRDHITAHFYTCTEEILAGLGRLYAAGGEIAETIDRAGGAGAAAFAAEAIAVFCGAE